MPSELWVVFWFYAIEVVFVACAVLFFKLVRRDPHQHAWRTLGGIFSGLAAMYLFAFAPLFLPIQGEWMLGTLPLAGLGTPFAIWFCIYIFRKL
jgi:hypothetical protein